MSRIKPIFKAATPEQIAKRPNKIILAGGYIHPGIYEREIDIGDYIRERTINFRDDMEMLNKRILEALGIPEDFYPRIVLSTKTK